MITIALDCGASFLKGAVFEADGHLREFLLVPATPSARGEDAKSVLLPLQAEALLDKVRSMLRKLSSGERRARLCIANEMHGFLLTDAEGVPQMDYLSWQRSLGALPIEGGTAVSVLMQNCAEAIWRTGMPLRGSLPSANLLHLFRRGILARMTGELFFCTLGDYILRALAGKAAPIHPTNAAASGLYDLESGEWSAPLIQMVTGGRVRFPEVGESSVSFSLDGGSLRRGILPWGAAFLQSRHGCAGQRPDG